MPTNDRAPEPGPAPDLPARPTPAPARPAWFEALVADFTSGVANTYLLHGGIFDYVEGGRTVREYLAEAFGALKDVVAYSPDEGLTFPLASTRRRFDETVGLARPATNEAYAFLRAAADGADSAAPDGPPLPTQPLPAVRLLLEFLLRAETEKAVALVERLDLLVPAGDKATFPEARLALLSLLHRAGTDRRLDARGNMLVLLAPSLEEVHPDLRAASSGIRAIEVPPPDLAARLAYIEERIARGGLTLQMRPEELAAQTAGLYRRHIEDVALRALAAGGTVTHELVRARKRESIATEYAEVLEVIEPAFGFDAIGGHAQAKRFLLQWIIRPLREGMVDMVPLGVAFLGPPGTGKSVLALATAKEAGLNCVLLRPEKIKGGIVGESERRLAKALGGIESLAPCLVFVDELDQRFQRGQGGGDGGAAVESNLFGRLLEFFGDPAHRGRIVAMAASVTGDTPVFVRGRGVVPIASVIDEAFSGDEEGERAIANLEVLGYRPKGDPTDHPARYASQLHRYAAAQFSRVHSVYRHHVTEVLEVEYTSGHVVRMTDAHSVFTVGPKGRLAVKRAGDLKPGAVIAPPSERGDKLVPLPGATWPRGSGARGRHQYPVDIQLETPETPIGPLTAELAFMLGLWLAEGYVHGGKHIDFCLSSKEVELQRRVDALAASLDRRPYRKPTRAGGAVNCGFSHAVLARWMTANFGCRSSGKHLPTWAFTLPAHLFDAMLDGCLTGDGYERRRSQRSPGIRVASTVSKRLAVEMVWASRMHGRWATLNEKPYRGGRSFGSRTAYLVGISAAGRIGHRPMVKAMRRVPFDGFVYDFCGCDGEAFYGGEVPILLHNTNRPDLVDAALFRPGRFDVKIPLLPPETAEERAEVFGAALRRYGHPAPEGEVLARCGGRTENWTQAEIERAVVKANGLARLRGLPIDAALDEALALLRPATRDVRLMTALAVAECDDASLLPARYRALLDDRDALDAEIARRTADEPGPRGRQARSLDL